MSTSGWEAVGDRVREARAAAGLSQGELAGQVGLDRTAVVRIEKGERGLNALELFRLADVLSVPPAYFVTPPPPAMVSRRTTLVDQPTGADRLRFQLDVALQTHARDTQWLLEAGVLTPPSPMRFAAPDPVAMAGDVRRTLGLSAGPIGPMAGAAERCGLYLTTVDLDVDGASVALGSCGAAVVGAGPDPGRRRWTAAHELGHHLLADEYQSEVEGVSASRDERERLIDRFAGEFLLPEAELRSLLADARAADVRVRLIEIAGTYRLSWSAVVARAREAGVLDDLAAQRLRAHTPVRGDFIAVLGTVPLPDLGLGEHGPTWQQAVLRAYRNVLITADRAVEMLGTLSVADLPDRDV